jgi:FkbM family methyltransferase
MSAIAYHTKVYFQNIVREFNKFRWSLGGSTHRIQIIKNQWFTVKHYGIIAEVLFTEQHLIGTNQAFETKTLDRFSKLVKPNDTVLDIGANIGMFSLLGSRLVGDNGRIIAFEPSRKTFDILNENLKLNNCKNVETVQLALGDTEGSIFLGEVENDALNFIDKNQKSGEEVALKLLDNYLQENKINKIDFIKIDIEGAEFLCFKGATEMLKNHRPTIIMECNENWCHRFGYSVFELLNFLSQFDYRFENYDDNQWLCFPN